ncbi:CvpA family protein [Pigmentiphaga soli]|uniref:CvpA family protein n=1 Tax=Pigmentiphaga soli TaxID=1007095 RepID=A0ABP8HJZ4_9BURK
MTPFDYGVLVILAASMVIGLLRGLVKEVLSLIAYAAAFYCAYRVGPMAYEWLAPHVDNTALRFGLAYGGVFIATLLVVGLVNMALAMAIRATGLTPADRGLGALFGLLRGAAIVLVLVVAAGFTPLPKEPWWTGAMLSPLAEDGARAIKPMLPAPFADWIRY